MSLSHFPGRRVLMSQYLTRRCPLLEPAPAATRFPPSPLRPHWFSSCVIIFPAARGGTPQLIVPRTSLVATHGDGSKLRKSSWCVTSAGALEAFLHFFFSAFAVDPCALHVCFLMFTVLQLVLRFLLVLLCCLLFCLPLPHSLACGCPPGLCLHISSSILPS